MLYLHRNESKIFKLLAKDTKSNLLSTIQGAEFNYKIFVQRSGPFLPQLFDKHQLDPQYGIQNSSKIIR